MECTAERGFRSIEGRSSQIVDKDQPFTGDRSDLELGPETLPECRQDLLGSSRAELRVEAGSRPDDDRRARFDREIDQQRSQVVRDGPGAFRALPWESRRSEKVGRRPAKLRWIDGSGQLDPVVRGDNTTSQWRPGQPDIDELDEPPALREPSLQCLSDAPGGPPFHQDDVDELAIRGYADGEWRAERDPRPRPIPLGPRQRQSGRLDRGRPGVRDISLRSRRCAGIARCHQPPALAGFDRP